MEFDRRTLLATAGATGTALLAGCGTATGEIPPPEVPRSRLDSGGWEQTDETTGVVFERDFPGVTVTATQHTLRYSDEKLQDTIKQRTLGSLDAPLNVFFASRVDFAPNLDNLPGGIGRQEIMNAVKKNAKSRFEQQLQNAGLTDISESGTETLTVKTGETAELTTYAATRPIEDFGFSVADGESLTIEGGAINVPGRLAIWHHGDFALISGGAHPGENFTRSQTKELSDGITVSVDIDLKLTPEAYRTEIQNLIKDVE